MLQHEHSAAATRSVRTRKSVSRYIRRVPFRTLSLSRVRIVSNRSSIKREILLVLNEKLLPSCLSRDAESDRDRVRILRCTLEAEVERTEVLGLLHLSSS